jgi:hypothetical protein
MIVLLLLLLVMLIVVGDMCTVVCCNKHCLFIKCNCKTSTLAVQQAIVLQPDHANTRTSQLKQCFPASLFPRQFDM